MNASELGYTLRLTGKAVKRCPSCGYRDRLTAFSLIDEGMSSVGDPDAPEHLSVNLTELFGWPVYECPLCNAHCHE
ncbi:MAG TPA: hypothetical protein PKD86_00095 [Gemmatales bacterium]|nr:hypothetical protein [Gemmatales bacterium]